MTRKAVTIPDAELAVLQCLWERGSASARELTEALYPGGGAALVATVQKLLSRLEAKDCVTRDRSTWPHSFKAAVERADVLAGQLQQAADRLCDGALQPLLTHLVKTTTLSSEERRSLRELLDELDQRPGSKK